MLGHELTPSALESDENDGQKSDEEQPSSPHRQQQRTAPARKVGFDPVVPSSDSANAAPSSPVGASNPGGGGGRPPTFRPSFFSANNIFSNRASPSGSISSCGTTSAPLSPSKLILPSGAPSQEPENDAMQLDDDDDEGAPRTSDRKRSGSPSVAPTTPPPAHRRLSSSSGGAQEAGPNGSAGTQTKIAEDQPGGGGSAGNTPGSAGRTGVVRRPVHRRGNLMVRSTLTLTECPYACESRLTRSHLTP